ncbi:hypothetical protein EDD15DRAFT_1900766 [Pisolithus albus]|nr:hypothetical protein EDD15DRAFT_1900766 [Pisolithus albus]
MVRMSLRYNLIREWFRQLKATILQQRIAVGRKVLVRVPSRWRYPITVHSFPALRCLLFVTDSTVDTSLTHHLCLAILFPPPFAFQTSIDPTYPNYALPLPTLCYPKPLAPSPTFDLVLAPLSIQLTSSQTASILANLSSAGTVELNNDWQGNQVNGDRNGSSRASHRIPITLHTWYGAGRGRWTHLCRHQVLYVAFYTHPLLEYMTNFTTMVLTSDCGRDLYFPLQTCSSCPREYRSWLLQGVRPTML